MIYVSYKKIGVAGSRRKILSPHSVESLFFHDKEDNSNASDEDIFETLHVRKSKWTPPEGQFASLDFFIKNCRHDIQKLKFNCHTKFSNLSSEEWLALKNLSKRHDIVIKSADKGGAVVVWRSDLYKEEALR